MEPVCYPPIGVAHLARKLVKRLSKEQPELEISPKDIQNVTIAGLCHDIAAGPYTNAFSRFMRKIE
ncbi:MAG: HD domain-containing protein [Candidatus Pacebacteria bacterium]|nr:HD domain-containing protein [Candidatus Paceibacterota bacterium]